MNFSKSYRLWLTGVATLIAVGCTTSNYSHPEILLKGPQGAFLAVHFMETKEGPLVVGTESKLASRDTLSDQAALNFSSTGFTQVSQQDVCIELICWNLWLYEPAATHSTDKIISEINMKIRKAFELLPDQMQKSEPYRLEVYLVPPGRAFQDTVENTNSGLDELKFAIHHDFAVPVSNRELRSYQARQADMLSTLVHEFVHFALLKAGYYEDPFSYASIVHSEAMGKCYGQLSYLRILDSDSKATHITIIDEKPKNVTFHKNESGSWDANDHFAAILKKEFIEAGSKSISDNMIVLSARDEREINIIKNNCDKLLAGNVEIN